MRRQLPAVLLGLCLAALWGGLAPDPALAHGFGQRYDLPVPLWLYITGAGAAVALSFAVIGVFLGGARGLLGYPRLNLLRRRAVRAAVHPAVLLTARVASVALLVLVVTAGLIGDQAPASNLAPTLVWVIWWVGLAYVSALVGDVWGFLNPWKTVFGWAEGLYRRIDSEGELSFHHRYPPGLGVWPGVLLLAAFAWVELVYVDSATPLRIAQMAGVYSVLTWGGMLLFGREQWVRHAEVFSLAFGLLARFAPTEVRVTDPAACDACRTECRDLDGQCIGCCDCYERAPAEARELNLRPFAAGLLRNEAVSPSLMVFILLLLSTVTFDGFTATPLWSDIVILLFDAVPDPTAIGTLGLLVFPVLFIGVYLAVTALMAATSGRRLPAGDMARAFVFSLVPIALAYHLAHFLSFLLIQGQLIIPLASDPFGFGWNVLGTAGYQVNIGIVDARFAWFTAVAAIVAGHIIAVYLAHVIAIRTLRDRPLALRSQYPMLGLMVGYTMVSLWILAQPIVEAPAG